jgi:protein-tyrosine phosphatase
VSFREPCVLFLCSGNYYRSRFAEHLFNARARARGLAWRAESRGLEPDCFTRNPGPISQLTLAALHTLSIPLEGPARLPRDVTAEDLELAARVIALKEAEHRPLMERRFPEFAARVEYWHVDDTDCAPAETALPQIEALVASLLLTL